ncbi:hypothetical protein XENOCAPTIV_004787 [Xenoophorus captivus]|uniref:Uncharacterized protein n=1 Tax=Xenoophorus captivus TaxID=1517983 RepID=A0ABV0RGV4_9TELE
MHTSQISCREVTVFKTPKFGDHLLWSTRILSFKSDFKIWHISTMTTTLDLCSSNNSLKLTQISLKKSVTSLTSCAQLCTKDPLQTVLMSLQADHDLVLSNLIVCANGQQV